MDKKLSEIIKELEDAGAIRDFYLHNTFCTGEIELNIEFKNEIADKILKKHEIEETDFCAYWE